MATEISGDLILVTESPAQVSQVWVRSRGARGYQNDVVLDQNDQIPTPGGQVSFKALPGPASMVLVVNGQPARKVPLIIPDKATASLREAWEAAAVAGAGELTALERLASEVASAVTDTLQSQLAAAESESQAGSSASAAKTSETNAGRSATNAATSASAAKTSETNAKTSETNAKTSETNAATANSDAQSAKNAAESAQTKTESARDKAEEWAGDVITDASKARDEAVEAANRVGSAERVLGAESTAVNAAGRAEGAASAAGTSETNAKTSETNASTSESNAGNSATASANSAAAAKTSETNAKTAESNAKTSETNAGQSASSAAGSATAADTSATNAATSETNARQSASDALTIKNSIPQTVATEVDTQVPPAVAEAIGADQTIVDAATAAVSGAVDGMDLMEKSTAEATFSAQGHDHTSAALTDATHTIGYSGTVDRVVKTNDRGQIFVASASITSGGDVVNKLYADAIDAKIQPIVAERQRTIEDGTDWNTLTSPGPYKRRYNNPEDINSPVPHAGNLQVLPTDHPSGMVAQLFAAYGEGGIWYRAGTFSGAWSHWKNLIKGEDERFERDIPAGTDWDTLTEPGFYRRRLSSDTDLNDPDPAGTGISPTGGLVVIPHGTTSGTVSHLFIGSANWGVMYRSKSGSGLWTPWSPLGGGSAGYPLAIQEGAARREFLMSNFMDRRGGSIGTGGKAVVALRFDHHTRQWQEKVLPLLRQYRLPWALALNPRNQGTGNDTMSWADIQQVALETGGEVFNHGATHGDAQTREQLEDEIVTSLTELREHLPLLPIDGWMQPGTGGSFGGMQNFQTVENYTTEAGRMVLSHHPVVYGHKTGKLKQLDGRPAIGQVHHGLDSKSFANVKTVIDRSVATSSGVVLMLHPNFLDQSGRMSTETLGQIFAYIAQLRDEGKLVVLSPSAIQLADASHGFRRPILTAPADGSTTQQLLDWDSNLAADGVHELQGTLEGSGEITVTVYIRDPATTVTITTPPGEVWLPVSLPVGADLVEVTVTGATGGSLTLRAA